MRENVLIMEKHDFVCTITFNRPEKRNALSDELLTGFAAAMNAMSEDSSVRVVVLRGAGDKAFSAGYDIGGIPPTSHEDSGRLTKDRNAPFRGHPLRAATQSIINHPCPVIAMINGLAMGAGCQTAAVCDIRVAAETARFGMPPVKLGVIYDPEGIRHFVDLVGVAATKELFLTGDLIDAERAREIGLVNHVAAARELEAITYDLARRIAANAPLSVSGLKKIISKVVKKPPLSQEDEEEIEALVAKCTGSYDFQEGIRAFKEKRAPKFEGR